MPCSTTAPMASTSSTTRFGLHVCSEPAMVSKAWHKTFKAEHSCWSSIAHTSREKRNLNCESAPSESSATGMPSENKACKHNSNPSFADSSSSPATTTVSLAA